MAEISHCARYLTAGDDLPGKTQPGSCPFVIITKMLALHVADRHRTRRRLSDLFGRRGRRVPGVTTPGSASTHRVSRP